MRKSRIPCTLGDAAALGLGPRARGGGPAACGCGSRCLGRQRVGADAAALGLAGRARGGGPAADGGGSRRLGRRREWADAAAFGLGRRARGGGPAAPESKDYREPAYHNHRPTLHPLAVPLCLYVCELASGTFYV